MKKMILIKFALVLGVISLSGANAVAQETVSPVRFYPYERGYPNFRPAKAPVASFERDADWYANALVGVSKPYPNSLTFLDSQGAWYTPFNQPGMTGPYDLRGMHRARPVVSETDFGNVLKTVKRRPGKEDGMGV